MALRVLSSGSSPFASLDPAQLDALLQRMPVWEYAPDESLITMGDPGDDLVVILSGSAQAFIRRAPGDRTMVGAFRPGDIVGEIGVLTGEARTADVVAQTEVRALRLAAADFSAIANAHPDVRMLLTNIVADHLGQCGLRRPRGQEHPRLSTCGDVSGVAGWELSTRRRVRQLARSSR